MLEIVENLPYKAIVAGVTSAYVEKSSGKEFADIISTEQVVLPKAGHINAESGYDTF